MDSIASRSTKRILQALVVSLAAAALSGCAVFGPVGYWLSERWHRVDDVRPPFAWQVAEHPQAGVLYRQAAERRYLLGMLLVHDGRLVAEWYAPGRSAEDAVNIKSVSKSVLSALVGIAIADGLIDGVEQPLSAFYPELAAHAPQGDIRIRHLLTMSAGFRFEENGNDEVYFGRDWARNILDLPMANAPGKSFNYGTVQTHLLSDIITRRSGIEAAVYAQRKLFEPMGISLRGWARSPNGVTFGGSQMLLTPRDMAAFGWMFNNEGRFGDRQLVPADWVRESTAPKYRKFHRRGDERFNYGYWWWTRDFAGHPAYFAEGFGGQLVVNIPDLRATVVLASETAVPDDDAHAARFESLFALVEDGVVPLLAANAELATHVPVGAVEDAHPGPDRAARSGARP